ncbi:MAG: hypothetical protein ABR909_09315 [Candidatus Bathyarchaeia archaeon]|jgi:hypothetical protein
MNNLQLGICISCLIIAMLLTTAVVYINTHPTFRDSEVLVSDPVITAASFDNVFTNSGGQNVSGTFGDGYGSMSVLFPYSEVVTNTTATLSITITNYGNAPCVIPYPTAPNFETGSIVFQDCSGGGFAAFNNGSFSGGYFSVLSVHLTSILPVTIAPHANATITFSAVAGYYQEAIQFRVEITPTS